MKKTLILLLAGGLALGVSAGVAKAANVDINLNGASAEFTYWTTVAPLWLKATGNGAGCSGNVVTQTVGSSNFLAYATGCTLNGGNPITVRVSSTNSLDGIESALGTAPADSNSCSGRNRTYITDQSGTAASCLNTDLGASDVGGEAFGQSTHGNYLGPVGAFNGSGQYTGNLNWKDITASAVTIPSGVDTYNPLVVPFGFYLHSDVQVGKCSAGSGTSTANAGIYAGQQCSTNAHCGTLTANGAGVCSVGNVPGISREQAVAIFSGQVFYWADLGGGYTATGPTGAGDISVCMRHAGSGTLATLHRAVMYNSTWGNNMLATQAYPAGSTPETWFNNGTGDIMNCVSARPGAIGYADADRLASNPVSNVYGPVMYNGYTPSRINIRNGAYDSFWSAQHIYQDHSEPNYNASKNIVAKLMVYANDPNNIPSSKAPYWATQSEMQFGKTTDTTYPTLQGATNMQTP